MTLSEAVKPEQRGQIRLIMDRWAKWLAPQTIVYPLSNQIGRKGDTFSTDPRLCIRLFLRLKALGHIEQSVANRRVLWAVHPFERASIVGQCYNICAVWAVLGHSGLS